MKIFYFIAMLVFIVIATGFCFFSFMAFAIQLIDTAIYLLLWGLISAKISGWFDHQLEKLNE